MSSRLAPAVGGPAGVLSDDGDQRRVLAIFQAGRAGRAVLRRGSELTREGGRLWVVALAPQARALRCCGGAAVGPYNCAVRDEAREELAQARELLGADAARASFTVLSGTPEPPLEAFVAEHAFAVVLVPRARLAREGGRLARALRRHTGARVEAVVG